MQEWTDYNIKTILKNNENIILTAGAGTGKTHALVEEYIVSLLGFDGCNNRKMPENVFAVTFTEKAAAEMRIRINNRLLKLSNSEHLINDSIFIILHGIIFFLF